MAGEVIVALDFPSGAEALDFLDLLRDEKPFVKVGMELFYAEGPEIVRAVKARGHRLFLDLKLHDIPNTVMRAMAVLLRLGVDMVNVHAAGTADMMRAAVRGLSGGGRRPLLIAVTQLTSTTEEAMRRELLVDTSMEEAVMHYARNARDAELDGVVCSPLEAAAVKRVCGAGFLAVTPGVRFEGGDVGDQARVMTPGRARVVGSDFIVMGRPITGAKDPAEAYRRAADEFAGRK